MKRPAYALLALLLFTGAWWLTRGLWAPPQPGTLHATEPATGPVHAPASKPSQSRARPPEAAGQSLGAAEKAARVERIKRDYDEIRAKASADYSAAGAGFPGGLNAFLRQLALLEREKWADIAAVLSPRELEDLQLRDTNAGQQVQQRLGNAAVTDEQRRTVFRLQFDFDNRFALTFDTSPAALLEREQARQVLETAIGEVLVKGNSQLFAAWDEDFARALDFTSRQGLPTDTAWRLWDLKNEFTVKRLELITQGNISGGGLAQATNALIRQTEARAMNIVGPGPLQIGRNDAFSWLPVPK